MRTYQWSFGLEIVSAAATTTAAAAKYKKFKFVIMQAVDHKLWFVLLVSFSFSPSVILSSSVYEQHLAALRLKNECKKNEKNLTT